MAILKYPRVISKALEFDWFYVISASTLPIYGDLGDGLFASLYRHQSFEVNLGERWLKGP